MQELSESIRSNGVIEPIIVRPINDKEFEFEIIAGHRRTRMTQLTGLTSIPCDIRDIDDAVATLIMIDSNLQQRESILPSEKVWAYKYKLESVEKISGNSKDSRNQIRRYIRLTHLIPHFIKKVDENKLAFIPTVQLSYLSPEEQEWLYDILN